MRRKRRILYLSSFSVFCAAVLFLWTESAERAAHFTPDYEKISLEAFLEKAELADEDYAVIFGQTGLARPGVDELCRLGRQGELLCLQERFFAPVKYHCSGSYVICRSERLDGEETGDTAGFLPTAHTGDILITFSGHVFGWRSGHAAIVVDGEKGLTLEAISPGCNSCLCELSHWREYPQFVLLRPKNLTEQECNEIAAYAVENMNGVPYDLFQWAERGNGQGGAEAAAPDEDCKATGTQCAHLVWAAYYHFGYDLDSDGGYIVTPMDLCRSGLLEVVQVYGIDAKKLIK